MIRKAALAAVAVASAGTVPNLAVADGSTAVDHRQTAPDDTATINMIEYVPSQYDWCYYAARDQEYFADEGIELNDDPLQVGTDADLNRAILAGEGDLSIGTIGLFQTYAAGEEPAVVMIGGSGMAGYSFVGQAGGETGLDSLEGQTVAMSPAEQPSALVAIKILTEALGEGGFTPLHMGGGSGARIAALEAGQATGAFMAGPYDSVAVAANPDLQIIDYLDSGGADYEIGVILARRDWLEENHDVAVRWMRAYQRGCEWLYDPTNREAAVALLAGRVGAEPEAIELTYDVYIAGDLAGTTPIRDGSFSRDALIASVTVMQEAGQIDGNLDVAEVVDAFLDPTVVEEALGE